MKISKSALEALTFPILLLVMWNLIVVLDFFGEKSISPIDYFFTVVIDVLCLYFLTDGGFAKVKVFFSNLFNGLLILAIIVIVVGVVIFIAKLPSLPPTTVKYPVF